jgi:hypothetical protein
VATAGESVLEGKERDGVYRNMVLFDNPLSNAEYLVLSASTLLAAYALRVWPYLLAGILPFYIPAIAFTGSRSPWLVMTMTLMISAYLLIIVKQTAHARLVSKLVLRVSGILFVPFIYWAVNNPRELLSIVALIIPQSHSDNISTLSRLFQYAIIPHEIFWNGYWGVLGAGIKSSFLENVGIPLDNYYLRVLIEGGAIGVVAFLYMQYFLVMKAATEKKFSGFSPRLERRFRFSMLYFFVSFSIYKLFLSMTFNSPYYYLMVGIFIAIQSESFECEGTHARTSRSQ